MVRLFSSGKDSHISKRKKLFGAGIYVAMAYLSGFSFSLYLVPMY